MLEKNIMEHLEKRIAALMKEHGNNKYMMGALHAYQDIQDELQTIVQKLEASRLDYWQRSDEILRENFMMSVALISRSDAYNDALSMLGYPKRIADGKCRICGKDAAFVLTHDEAIAFCKDHMNPIDDKSFYKELKPNNSE